MNAADQEPILSPHVILELDRSVLKAKHRPIRNSHHHLPVGKDLQVSVQAVSAALRPSRRPLDLRALVLLQLKDRSALRTSESVSMRKAA